jgi:hypothetical protein
MQATCKITPEKSGAPIKRRCPERGDKEPERGALVLRCFQLEIWKYQRLLWHSSHNFVSFIVNWSDHLLAGVALIHRHFVSRNAPFFHLSPISATHGKRRYHKMLVTMILHDTKCQFNLQVTSNWGDVSHD